MHSNVSNKSTMRVPKYTFMMDRPLTFEWPNDLWFDDYFVEMIFK